MMMGRPTQRRHSSMSTAMPQMPITSSSVPMRAPIIRMGVVFTAKYINDAAPTTMSTMSYHGMWLGECPVLETGYIRKPMMMTKAKKRARRVSACSTLNSVMYRQYTENSTITPVMMAFGTPVQMRVLDSRSYLRITSSTSTSALLGTLCSSFTSLFFLMLNLLELNMLIALLAVVGYGIRIACGLGYRGGLRVVANPKGPRTQRARKAFGSKSGSQRHLRAATLHAC